jgi:hypothetical protein
MEMVRLRNRLLWSTVMLAGTQDAVAATGPVLVGDAVISECEAALEMAKAAFVSNNPSLNWPIIAPIGPDARIVFYRTQRDVYGGVGVSADPDVFDRFEAEESTIFYWQIDAQSGQRIVVSVAPSSWRGDVIGVFVANQDLAQSEFLRAYRHLKRSSFRQLAFGVQVLRGEELQPPTVLQDPDTAALWILDQAEWTGLTPWQVYTFDSVGVNQPCRISFTSDESVGLAAMPPAVRRFAALADEALGPGSGEGTLQQTARRRAWVAQSWMILSERPWALTNTPPNSREVVDAGLAHWAEGVPARARLLQDLQDIYGPAEQELADFLVLRFALDEDDARIFSAYAMDHMLRSHFVFPRTQTAESPALAQTPWPENMR